MMDLDNIRTGGDEGKVANSEVGYTRKDIPEQYQE